MNYTLSKMALTGMIALVFMFSGEKPPPNEEMINMLSVLARKELNAKNSFCPEARLDYYDSTLKVSSNFNDSVVALYNTGNVYLELGDEQKSVETLEYLLNSMLIHNSNISKRRIVMKALAIAYLRSGERANCVHDHSGESCIFPVSGNGIHADKRWSQKAIKLYKDLIQADATDLESRWLINIAYMTIGGYPKKVPAAFLIKGLDADTSSIVKPFIDAAINIGLNTRNMAGGSIVDDFNNDGYLDVITSSWSLDEGMHYCRNNSKGAFIDASESSGLGKLKGGLNIMQTDYNNDGLKDIFVLRGAWKAVFGKEPNSLLRNNGDGTFTDVTRESGLLSFHPTQTATWADFNNDGWLDVFIGNETTRNVDYHPCELYINNKNGTFTEVAGKAGCNIAAFVKGVTSGDYDNDGLTDIFISTLDGWKILLKNQGVRNGVIHFEDMSQHAGLTNNLTRTFPTWFWDYDNDGWLDILTCGYDFDKSLAWYAAAEALDTPVGNSGKVILFRNRHDGTFEDVSEKVGLNKIAFAMGANFGDIDNDGYLDIYLGTGNPLYRSLVPNKMFKNINGRKFTDITTAARVGNLQKGHGISFADLDNDGDEDVYIEMGGAYAGDAYPNSLYINPGQNNNNWISLLLDGSVSNRAAIGARIKVTFKENGIMRSVYRDVNSGGSFGASPLEQHIGIGSATMIESIEIKWPGSLATQVFKNIQPNRYVKIKEGTNFLINVLLRKIDFLNQRFGIISCSPG